MNISAELKILVIAACSAAYVANAAAPVDADNGVLYQSNNVIANLGLASSKDGLANKCVSYLINEKRFDSESLTKAEPRLRTAFQNVCAAAYSGKVGYEAALFLMYPLSDAAKRAGDEKLARAAEDIIEVSRETVYTVVR